jgi:hypothetical protein
MHNAKFETGRRGAGLRRPLKRNLLLSISAAFVFVMGIAFAPIGSAHEPITTKVRFNKEVIRILERNCFGCHKPGGIAPWSLITYDEARPWAKAIKEEILEKRMPVWHAVKGYGEFSNAPTMTQREIDLIVNWVEGGAPKGDDKDLPTAPVYSNDWSLGKPDLILKPEKQQEVASDADEYRTIVLPVGLKEDRWIAAIDLLPGNASVVYSATLYLEKQNPQVSANKGAASKFASASILATWVPGQKAVTLGEDTGQLLPAGSRIIAKIRYRGAGEAIKDRSLVGLYFSKSQPKKQTREIAITNPDSVIPVGSTPHQVKLSFTTQEDAEAIAIRPRANPLTVSLQATVFRPDGTEEVLIWTRGYHFDWQQTYQFRQPVSLPKGSRIEVIAYFDNSETNPKNPNSPPRQVRWADISEEPLCAILVATERSTSDTASIR